MILPINYSLFSKTQGPQGPASKLLFRPSVAGPCAYCSNGKRRRVPQGPKAYSQKWLFMAPQKTCGTLRPFGPLFWVLAIGCVVLLDMLAGWAQRDGCLNTALMASGGSVPGGIFCHTGPHRRIPPIHHRHPGTGRNGYSDGFCEALAHACWFVAFSRHCFRFPVSAVGPKTPGLALVIMPSRAERG